MRISVGANQATALFDTVKQLIHTSKEGVGQVVRVARRQQSKKVRSNFIPDKYLRVGLSPTIS